MKEGLKLKIGKFWCALKNGTSISIDMTSPLWNDSGSFSYTFAVPYTLNRHIFNASDSPESDVNLKTFRERFELYIKGIGLLFGDVVCSGDEIDEDDDSVEIELRSGNATLEDAIEGKSLRDLDFGTDAEMGTYEKTEKVFTPEYVKYTSIGNLDRVYYPYKGDGGSLTQKFNGSDMYPIKPFINIPVLVTGVEKETTKKPLFLSTYRRYSSPCFFMLYVLKKVFAFANLGIQSNELEDIEDFKRIIFINTSCKYKIESTSHNISGTHEFEPFGTGKKYIFTYTGVEWTGNVYFTSENLPDTNISDFISSLKNAFGMRIISRENGLSSIILLRNVFRGTDTYTINMANISSIKKIHEASNDIVVRFSNNDGDEFEYSDYDNPRVYKDYESILLEWNGTKEREGGEEELEKDVVLKISRDTGNFFRTKVDKEEYNEPQLFEVAQFLSYKVDGEGLDKGEDELTIDFNPIIPTTTNNATVIYSADTKVPAKAFYADVEIGYERYNDLLSLIMITPSYTLGYNYDRLKSLLEYDCGFTLGIVRSTPDGSYSNGYTIVRTNADGFGNDEWVKTLSTMEVTSDSVDVSGALYDYNGTDEGIGIDPSELISLRIWNNKQNFDPKNLVGEDEEGNSISGAAVYDNNPTGPLPNRGLVPQFLSEYLHFLKYRKKLVIVGEMEVVELTQIRWEKYYKIEGYRCLLNKISFDVSDEGIGLVTLEVYCI